MEDYKLKDAFALWWEFLKLSDAYKKYCDSSPPWRELNEKLEKLGEKFHVSGESRADKKNVNVQRGKSITLQ